MNRELPCRCRRGPPNDCRTGFGGSPGNRRALPRRRQFAAIASKYTRVVAATGSVTPPLRGKHRRYAGIAQELAAIAVAVIGHVALRRDAKGASQASACLRKARTVSFGSFGYDLGIDQAPSVGRASSRGPGVTARRPPAPSYPLFLLMWNPAATGLTGTPSSMTHGR